MLRDIEAVFENGVLRPLEPLALAEREHVRVAVTRASVDDWMDVEYMNACADHADLTITLDQVRASLASIHGSMDDAIDLDRGDK